jgi:hypothetical protein
MSFPFICHSGPSQPGHFKKDVQVKKKLHCLCKKEKGRKKNKSKTENELSEVSLSWDIQRAN